LGIERQHHLGPTGVNEQQRLFLVQARSGYAVFELLKEQPAMPSCHPLHYLQMATEMLGKAHAWKTGPRSGTHRAIVAFLRSLSTNRAAQQRFGLSGKNEAWSSRIRSSIALAEGVERLAPAIAKDGPNPEYPWPSANPVVAPAEHEFELWLMLRDTAKGRQFVDFLGVLLETAEAYL
jgi:hypothetical protein